MRLMNFVVLGMAGLFAGGGCVTSGAYHRKVAELDAVKQQEAARRQATSARMLELEQGTVTVTARLRRAEQALSDAKLDLDDTRVELQGSTARAAELERRLDQLGQEVKQLSAERSGLTAALSLTGVRLEQLRGLAQATEVRAQMFRDLVQRLQGMIDAGKLTVSIRQGRTLIALPSDVVFDSGRTEVKRGAEATLVEVAAALRDLRDRKFLVVGHTDDVPIHNGRFPSNWELSAARAIAVARVLIRQGLAPRSLGIAGQAEFEPVVANDTAEHRNMNRRIEIVVEPEVAALPPGPAGPASPVSVR